MVRRSYTAEQIINRLREVDVHLNQGVTVGEASRKMGITKQTYDRWHKEYVVDLPPIIINSSIPRGPTIAYSLVQF